MTDNELRAHDIAVKFLDTSPPESFVLPDDFDPSVDKIKIHRDIIQDYLKYYHAALEALNKALPE